MIDVASEIIRLSMGLARPVRMGFRISCFLSGDKELPMGRFLCFAMSELTRLAHQAGDWMRRGAIFRFTYDECSETGTVTLGEANE